MQHTNDPFVIKLRQSLNQNQKINEHNFYAWKISVSDSCAMQSLMLGDPVQGLASYQEREVKDRAYDIEIYTRSGKPMVMGNSSYSIDPLAPLEEQIQKTLSNAMQVSNPPWDLPLPEEAEAEIVLTSDVQIKSDIKAAHAKLKSLAASKAKSIDQLKLNSAELYTNICSTYFETSTGQHGEEDRSDIYFEMALEKLPLPNTQEVLKMKTAISIEEANLPGFIDEVVAETLSIDQANLPKTQSNTSILLDGKTISDLLKNLITQLNASNEYNKTPFLSCGDKVFNGEKSSDSDKLEITLDPTLPIMAASSRFAAEGMHAHKAKVIENDTVLHQLVSNRIGQYLGKECNNITGNIVVPLGGKSKQELLQSVPECLDIISFSSLLIDPSTLTWSSEIKLAKLYHHGKQECIIKGGVVSGDLRENFKNFNFSNKVTKINEVGNSFSPAKGYVGPDAMLIKSGVKIAGE